MIDIFGETLTDYEKFEEDYKKYFGSQNPEYVDTVEIKRPNEGYSTFDEDNDPNALPMDNNLARDTAAGSIKNVREFAELLNRLLDIAWGSQWGTLKPVTAEGDDPDYLKFPMITYDTNLREVSDTPKPKLYDTVKEIVNGVYTGDNINIYRQSFDVILEFNFYGNSSLEMEMLSENFEELMVAHAGFLKNQGVSEIFFLKEVPSKYSLNFKDNIPSRCLYYYVKLERTTNVSLNLLNKIQERYYLLNSTEENAL